MNIMRAGDAERHYSCLRGKGSEGLNPKGGSGMKQGRYGFEELNRWEVEKTWERHVPSEANSGGVGFKF
jgi:hypothetical protein